MLLGRIVDSLLAMGEVASQVAGQLPSLTETGHQWFQKAHIPLYKSGIAQVCTFVGGIVFLVAGFRTIWAAFRMLFYTILLAYLCARLVLARSQ